MGIATHKLVTIDPGDLSKAFFSGQSTLVGVRSSWVVPVVEVGEGEVRLSFRTKDGSGRYRICSVEQVLEVIDSCSRVANSFLEQGFFNKTKEAQIVATTPFEVNYLLTKLFELDALQILLSNKRYSTIEITHENVQTRIRATWTDNGLMLNPEMQFSEGEWSPWPSSYHVLGTNPCVVLTDSKIFRFEGLNADQLSLFRGSNQATVPLSNAESIVRALTSHGNDVRIVFDNPEQLPPLRVVKPTPEISVTEYNLHSPDWITIRLGLKFDYPTSTLEGISCRNLEYESECQRKFEKLIGKGASVELEGATALNFIRSFNQSKFPGWSVDQLVRLRSKFTFRDLTLDLNLDLKMGSKHVKVQPRFFSDGKEFELTDLSRYSHGSYTSSSKFLVRQLSKGQQYEVISLKDVSPSVISDIFYDLSSNIFIKDKVSYFFRGDSNALPSFNTTWPIALSLLRGGDSRFSVSRARSKAESGRWLENLLNGECRGVKEPAGFSKNEKLLDHQKIGLNWLQFISQVGLGAILADEMGLGKTIQTLAYLQWRLNQKKSPSLVVTTRSTVENWIEEAQRFVPRMRVCELKDDSREGVEQTAKENDLIVVTHQYVRENHQLLKTRKWSDIIVDEAQIAKNPKSKLYKALCAIPAETRVALSGTPVENSISDLWALSNFVVPGILGDLDVLMRKVEYNSVDGVLSDWLKEWIADRTSLIVLRRTKAQVLPDLEAMKEVLHPIILESSERQAYNSLRIILKERLFESEDAEPDRGRILRAITHLRQFVNHPLSCSAWENSYQDTIPNKYNYVFSQIRGLLSEGKKIVLFSQFASIVQLFERDLRKSGVKPFKLVGATKSRQELVNRFNSTKGSAILLATTKTGGLGLNLTSADHIILFDPWWNPAVEAQAANRAHRIGRRGELTVHRYLVEKTVEQHLADIKAVKIGLFNSLMGGELRNMKAVSNEDLLELLDS